MNKRALNLTGHSFEDFQVAGSRWLELIYPMDREAYLNARQQLQRGEKSVSCEYRFMPSGQTKEMWLHEISVTFRFGNRAGFGKLTAYNDISELVTLRERVKNNPRSDQAIEIIPEFIHEMENNLQVIKGSLDLMRLPSVRSTAASLIETGLEHTANLLHELQQLVSQSPSSRAAADPAAILSGLSESMESDLRQRGIRLNLFCHGSLPAVRMDPAEFRRAVQTVLEFSRMLLPNGGELKVEARVREVENENYLELTVSSLGAVSVPENVFRPFLKINGHPLGLSMTLAREILQRHEGRIFFAKEPEQAARFTILLRVHSE